MAIAKWWAKAVEYNPVQTFLTEAEELLANIEQSALRLAEDTSPAETVNQLFRAFHTIKGSGAMCGLVQVSGFTHHVETLLQGARGRSRGITGIGRFGSFGSRSDQVIAGCRARRQAGRRRVEPEAH